MSQLLGKHNDVAIIYHVINKNIFEILTIIDLCMISNYRVLRLFLLSIIRHLEGTAKVFLTFFVNGLDNCLMVSLMCMRWLR